VTGAGADLDMARAPAVLDAEGFHLAVLGMTDHPEEFAASPDRPGVAFADLHEGVPPWVLATVERARAEADAVLVSPHWGPNMSPEPVGRVRVADELAAAGAAIVAGHSSHVFQASAGGSSSMSETSSTITRSMPYCATTSVSCS
jgi:poly-gamma-glutamate capsule biosynthesis protein CapA/YwtB (metallophosphatase superfamily)